MKNKKNSLIKVFIMAISSALFCAILLVFVFNILSTYKTNYLKAIGREQEILVNSVSRDISKILSETATYTPSEITSAENSAVENVIKKAEVSGSRYWIFGSTDRIIFIENDDFTKNFYGMTFEELLHQYKLNGGVGIQSFNTLISNKSNGTVQFSKSELSAVSLASIRFFTVGDKTYILSACTSSDYLLRMGDVYKNINYIAMSAIILCFAVMVITICFSLAVYRRNNTITQKDREIKNKNILIEKLVQKNDSDNAELISDELTGVYNKTFCDKFLAKIDSNNILNVGIVLIEIANLDEINKHSGTDKGNDILIKSADILKSMIKEQDIVCRVDNSTFAIIIMNTNFEMIQEHKNSISNAFSSNFTDIFVELIITSKLKTENSQVLSTIIISEQESFNMDVSNEAEYAK